MLAHLRGPEHLFLALLYGSGMRLTKGLRLRVKDIDFTYDQILVRDGKGAKDRVTMLPGTLKLLLREHLKTVKEIHEQDLRSGYGKVYLPYALARKYPQAGTPLPRTCSWRGYDIRTVQEILGHRGIRTTMVYTHVLNHGGRGVQSPIDSL